MGNALRTTQATIDRILRLNAAGGRGVLDLWLEGVRSGDPKLLAWFSQNRHMFERLFLIGQHSQTFADQFLFHHFGVERPRILPVFVCAMPKSGSTSFSKLLGAYLGRQVVEGHNKNSPAHALDMDLLRPFISSGAVIHTHLLPSADFLCLSSALSTPPIVLFRNLFDAIESRSRSEEYSSHSSLYGIPSDIESSVYRFSFEYISFAHQWNKMCLKNGWPILRFEENILDWTGAIRRTVSSLDLPFDENRASKIVSIYNNRLQTTPADFRISSGTKNRIPDFLQDHIFNISKRFGSGKIPKELRPLLEVR